MSDGQCSVTELFDYEFQPWTESGATRVVASEAMWAKPLKWNAECSQNSAVGVPRPRVFCASLCDVFEDWQGPMVDSQGERLFHITDPAGKAESRPLTMHDVRQRLFRLIDATPHLDWLLLTKRPENIRKFGPSGDLGMVGHPIRKRMWLGTSIATQADADRNIPELLKCRDLAPVLFASAEPLVKEIDLDEYMTCSRWRSRCPSCGYHDGDDVGTRTQCAGAGCGVVTTVEPAPHLDWVIAGGESGPHARPCNVEWIRSLRDQCKAADVAFFCKQLGARPYVDDSAMMGAAVDTNCIGLLPGAAMKDPKGGNWHEWPEDLRVREMPHGS